MKTNLRDFAAQSPTTHSSTAADPLTLDALIIGAGFSGIYALHTLRKQGLKTAIFEAGPGLGGIWRFNVYPGARVDSEALEYQFSFPEVWKSWTWSTNYPDHKEIKEYFEYVAEVLDLKGDIVFGAVVVDAQFDEGVGRWTVTTQDGRVASAKYLIAGTGFGSKRFVPDWPGLDLYKGVIHHSSFWPEEGVDVAGKRVAIIGTGASGVQLTQALGPMAASLNVFQRTPNLAIPMKQRYLTKEEQNQVKPLYPEAFQLRETAFGGFLYTFSEKSLQDDTPEEVEQFFESLWQAGGFRFWLSTYKDVFFDPQTNWIAYDFWARKARARIHDEALRDKLAPLEPPHAFGVKRPSLELDYFEQFNKENVHLVDVSDNAITRFTETGLQLADGTTHDFDVIALATGFDVSTGGLMDMGLCSIIGTTLNDDWRDSVSTYLGLCVSGYPNMFMMYGPQAPTAFCNGPTAVEVQGRWIADVIKTMERRAIMSIDPLPEAAREWKAKIEVLSNATLFPTVQRSTYMGGTIPGKPFEQLNWTGGLPRYTDEIRGVLPELKGFKIVECQV
jgi:cation diffusion facilitator CzcD-associated flavoprotein CzcO